MDEKIQIKMEEILRALLPDTVTDIPPAAGLRDSPDPAIRDLCEMAELIIRLSKVGRA